MNQRQAIDRARSRWGDLGYARLVIGNNGRTKSKGARCQVGFYMADISCPSGQRDCLMGTGSTWDDAFSDAMQRAS